nr:hypothetical protein [Tanacetum cinerariifolium]
MSFLSTVVTSRFPTTNNQLRNSSNPRQRATIHDGRVIVQPLQGRQNSFAAVLMANLSSYDSDVLSEVPYFENSNNDMLNQSVQEMTYAVHSQFVEHPENEIHSDSNIIPYSQHMIESQTAAV